MNSNDVVTALDWADTLLTIAQVALVVGCPTAGATWLAGRLLLRNVARVAIKRLTISATAGLAATAAAAFMTGDQGSAGPGGNYQGLAFSSGEMERSVATLSVDLDETGSPQYRLDDTAVPKDQLPARLIVPATVGQLREIQFVDRLPGQQHGEWVLHARGVLEAVVQLVPEFKIETQTEGS